MSEFSLPQEPTLQQAEFENGVIRWIITLLPVLIIGKIMGLLVIAAVLISMNFNILNWIE